MKWQLISFIKRIFSQSLVSVNISARGVVCLNFNVRNVGDLVNESIYSGSTLLVNAPTKIKTDTTIRFRGGWTSPPSDQRQIWGFITQKFW